MLCFWISENRKTGVALERFLKSNVEIGLWKKEKNTTKKKFLFENPHILKEYDPLSKNNYSFTLVNDYDESKEKTYSKELCSKYNLLKRSETNLRKEIIKEIFQKIGDNFSITSPFWCDYGKNIEIGDNFYSNKKTAIFCGGKIKFRNNIFIDSECGFITENINLERKKQGIEFIIIGNNVKIGKRVTIMPNVTIGNNVIIADKSIITENIPSDSIVEGNPCKIIRKSTKQDIKKLIKEIKIKIKKVNHSVI